MEAANNFFCSLNSQKEYDLQFSLLIFQKRDNLKIVISSATVDAQLFKDFFNLKSKKTDKDTSVILTVEGRMYESETHYLKGRLLRYLI